MNSTKKLHRYAAQLAKQLAKQQVPPVDQALLDYIDSHPEHLLESLQALVERLQAEVAVTDSLVEAYLFLIRLQLEHLRYQVDRHYDWARELIAGFQQHVVDLTRTGQLPQILLGQIAVALREAKLTVDPQLFTALEETLQAQGAPPAELPDVNELLDSLAKDIPGDEFAVTQALTEFTYALPVHARLGLAVAMLTSRFAILQNAVPLLILDDREAIRQGVARLLQETVRALTPAGLRRLIAIRSWLPEVERPLIDTVIKAARQQGIECAQWPTAENAEIYGSAIDGSGAQGFMIVSQVAKKYRLSSVLVRLRSGIVDAWRAQNLESKRTLQQQLAMATHQAHSQVVSRNYLDRALQHHLAVGCQSGQVPSLGLLEVAEVLGAIDWRPNLLDLAATVEQLFQGLPEDVRRPEAIAQCLRESNLWSAFAGLTESWFEDDQTVTELLSRSRARRLDTLIKRVLTEVLEPRRTQWAERLVWTALWLKDSATAQERLWSNFLLVAWALLQGQPVKEIPLFAVIAERTVLALHG